MNDQTFGLLVWYRNQAMPLGSDHCFSFEPEGEPGAVAVQISDMHASGTTLSSDVEVVPLETHFSDQAIGLMNQLMALEAMLLGDQNRSVGMIRDLFQSLMEKGAEIALQHQAAGR